MCGIAGILGPDRVATPGVVEGLGTSLAHRGPDDHGVRKVPTLSGGRSATLIHRRLSIIDLSPLGHQPMTDPATGNWIVYNGEIFNFRELRRELEASGARFISESDTEVILKLYAACGLDALNKLCGMFALALWDDARQDLLLAVDPVGIKPLYHCRGQGGCFVFASEIRSLLASGLVARSLDPVAVEDAVVAPQAVEGPLHRLGRQAAVRTYALAQAGDGVAPVEDVELAVDRTCDEHAGRVRAQVQRGDGGHERSSGPVDRASASEPGDDRLRGRSPRG